MEKLVKEFDAKKQECQRLKETWLPELEVLVADVSKRLKVLSDHFYDTFL